MVKNAADGMRSVLSDIFLLGVSLLVLLGYGNPTRDR
jgi:hypothetical protein